jgi:hypothetical protein
MSEVAREFDEKAWAQWVVDTCLLFGASAGTAHQVAGIFIEAVMAERRLAAKESKP